MTALHPSVTFGGDLTETDYPEFHALYLRVGSSARCALGDAAAFQLGGDGKHREHKLGKI